MLFMWSIPVMMVMMIIIIIIVVIIIITIIIIIPGRSLRVRANLRVLP